MSPFYHTLIAFFYFRIGYSYIYVMLYRAGFVTSSYRYTRRIVSRRYTIDSFHLVVPHFAWWMISSYKSSGILAVNDTANLMMAGVFSGGKLRRRLFGLSIISMSLVVSTGMDS